MTVDFYYSSPSPPCRTVFMTAKILGIELNKVTVDVLNKEHLKPEFIKINPQHTIPTINDDGFILWESRAIITYLVDQYGSDDSLYPKDPQKRAIVNQRLFFDAGTLYQRFAEAYYPLLMAGDELSDEKVKKLDDAYEFLNVFLGGSNFAAGDDLTVADISLVASVTTMLACDYDISRYPNVVTWLDKTIALLPDYNESNGEGVELFRQFYLKRVGK